MKFFKKIILILILLGSSLLSNGQDWVNVTPNQISNGWAEVYSNVDGYGNRTLVIYYQIFKNQIIQSDNRYSYYVYFFSGSSTNAVMLSELRFFADGIDVGGLNSIIIPLSALHVYIINSPNFNCQIGFQWKNSILY
jgi:hypothetical protein